MPDPYSGISAVKSRADLPGMSLLEHLEELRKRVLLSIVGMGVGFLACWHYAENIYEIVQRPVTDALRLTTCPRSWSI
jgi:sec-independent protein translocase protein TatC